MLPTGPEPVLIVSRVYPTIMQGRPFKVDLDQMRVYPK
jgi:hypothetical protein